MDDCFGYDHFTHPTLLKKLGPNGATLSLRQFGPLQLDVECRIHQDICRKHQRSMKLIGSHRRSVCSIREQMELLLLDPLLHIIPHRNTLSRRTSCIEYVNAQMGDDEARIGAFV